MEETKNKNKVIRSFQSVVTGSFLTREETYRFLPFIFFISLLAVVYIANGYYAEAKIRKQNKLAEQIKELRSEYIISKSDLMFISNQTEVAKAANKLGLKESVVPPKKIVLRKSNNSTTTQEQESGD